VDYSPYEGRQVTGIAETVLSRGRVIVENGAFVGRPGWGTFLRREPRNT
jgi:dihydropyrimidinase